MEKCCVVQCDKPLDETYWDTQYQTNTTGWDIGAISTPIKEYIDGLQDKTIRILIPGCGNTYEADYLLLKGFTNVTVIDISPTLIARLREKFLKQPHIRIIQTDFFLHQEYYDLIIEQTFFCALPPSERLRYAYKMNQLLSSNGKLVGLLFNTMFEINPPFGGSKKDYEEIFSKPFHIKKMEACYNSIERRKGTELFISLSKNLDVMLELFALGGVTCGGCKDTIIAKMKEISNVVDASISSNFQHLLLTSTKGISLQELQSKLSYDEKFTLNPTT